MSNVSPLDHPDFINPDGIGSGVFARLVNPAPGWTVGPFYCGNVAAIQLYMEQIGTPAQDIVFVTFGDTPAAARTNFTSASYYWNADCIVNDVIPVQGPFCYIADGGGSGTNWANVYVNAFQPRVTNLAAGVNQCVLGNQGISIPAGTTVDESLTFVVPGLVTFWGLQVGGTAAAWSADLFQMSNFAAVTFMGGINGASNMQPAGFTGVLLGSTGFLQLHNFGTAAITFDYSLTVSRGY